MPWIKIIQIVGLAAGIILKSNSIYRRLRRLNDEDPYA